MENAIAWFELGVKQQENEREYKALQALERAVELDSSHLPAWLALAISYANDTNRRGTYDAIYNWVSRNTKYQDAFQQYFAPNVTSSVSSPPAERNSQLIQCLITMARSNISGEIDADVQVALAVLLNTNEVCFDDGCILVSLILKGYRNLQRHKIVSKQLWPFDLM